MPLSTECSQSMDDKRVSFGHMTRAACGKYLLDFELALDFLDCRLELRQRDAHAVIGELVVVVVTEPSNGAQMLRRAQGNVQLLPR